MQQGAGGSGPAGWAKRKLGGWWVGEETHEEPWRRSRMGASAWVGFDLGCEGRGRKVGPQPTILVCRGQANKSPPACTNVHNGKGGMPCVDLCLSRVGLAASGTPGGSAKASESTLSASIVGGLIGREEVGEEETRTRKKAKKAKKAKRGEKEGKEGRQVTTMDDRRVIPFF